MNYIVTVPAGTQLDKKHVALKDIEFEIEQRGDVYSAQWVSQGRFGAIHKALSVADAVWLAKKDLGRLLDWIDSGDEDAAWARREIGQALWESVGHHEGVPNEWAVDGVILEGHLLEAGDGYEWSSLFMSGMDLAEALAAALRVDRLERSCIQLWGHDDEGEPVDPDSTIITVADEDERPLLHERLFYDFGRVRITVERVGG